MLVEAHFQMHKTTLAFHVTANILKAYGGHALKNRKTKKQKKPLTCLHTASVV